MLKVYASGAARSRRVLWALKNWARRTRWWR